MARSTTAVDARKASAKKRPKWGETLTVEEQHRIKRDALFRVAARAFNENGFHNTTLDDIAARLNVTKPALYYYVKSKDDIMVECYRVAFAHMKSAIDVAHRTDRPGMGRLTEFLKSYIELVANDFGRCLILTGLKPLTSESQAKLKPIARQINKALQEIVALGMRDGSIRKGNPAMVANAIFGSFNSVAVWHRESGALTPAMIGEQYIDVFVSGLRP